MFIQLTTSKGEKFLLNTEKVLFFSETKKGCSVVIEDGTLIDLEETYDEVFSQFVPCDGE
ncbi:MAG: hypothetical protein LUI60_02120 [Clostridia bacterium]|nr:hypothetical protein [Clostridia bacterium]